MQREQSSPTSEKTGGGGGGEARGGNGAGLGGIGRGGRGARVRCETRGQAKERAGEGERESVVEVSLTEIGHLML